MSESPFCSHVFFLYLCRPSLQLNERRRHQGCDFINMKYESNTSFENFNTSYNTGGGSSFLLSSGTTFKGASSFLLLHSLTGHVAQLVEQLVA